MKKYQIENTNSGIIFGVYEAESEDMALEELAKDAGYATYAEAYDAFPVHEEEILVTEI